MNWIKKNYDQFTLLLAALGLVGSGAYLYTSVGSFPDQFAAASAAPVKNNTIPNPNTPGIALAREQFQKPAQWKPRMMNKEEALHGGLLFTSELYYVRDRQLQKPGDGALWKDSFTGKSIPNKWFLGFSLPLLDSTVPVQDADGDGFLNEDEWRAGTDPTDKSKHPPYISKLFLKEWLKQPFRLKFQAYDGNPQTDKPESMTFQINPLDAGARTKFVKIGETVEGTKFKVNKFTFKEKLNDRTQEKEDASELEVENVETGDIVSLILNKVVDSPFQFAQLEYFWNKKYKEAGQVFVVPKLREFVLQPNIEEKPRYKLLDVNQDKAVIQRPDGQQQEVPRFKPAL